MYKNYESLASVILLIEIIWIYIFFNNIYHLFKIYTQYITKIYMKLLKYTIL